MKTTNRGPYTMQCDEYDEWCVVGPNLKPQRHYTMEAAHAHCETLNKQWAAAQALGFTLGHGDTTWTTAT